MTSAVDTLVERLAGRLPRVALVLGSGLGGLTASIADAVSVPFADLPGFPVSGVTGHAGRIVAGMLGQTPVLALSGRVHYYEHGDAAAMRPVIEAFAGIGITHLMLTNAAGSLRETMPPGSVMLITDHINLSGSNPLFGEPTDRRFVGLTNAYDGGMAGALRSAADALDIALHEGVYMWFSGPSFETPAEIRMARVMGADAVGMSTVPEVILARFFGMKVAACSVVTNLAAGMTGAELSHDETKDLAPIGGEKLRRLIEAALPGIAAS